MPLVSPFRTSFGAETGARRAAGPRGDARRRGMGRVRRDGRARSTPPSTSTAPSTSSARTSCPACSPRPEVTARGGRRPRLAAGQGPPDGEGGDRDGGARRRAARRRACRSRSTSARSATRSTAACRSGIMDSIAELLDAVGGYLDQGYRRIKLKIEPGWDVEPVRAVRERFGDDLPLQVDANTAYTLGRRRAPRPARPVRPAAHRAAAARGRPPRPRRAGQADPHADLPRRVDHLGARRRRRHRARRVRDRQHQARPRRRLPRGPPRSTTCARRTACPVWCGGMLETGIGRAANVALAALPNFTLPGDTSASDRYFHRDLTAPFVLAMDGSGAHRAGARRRRHPGSPGLGHHPYGVDPGVKRGPVSAKASSFTESVIREMTRLAIAARRRSTWPRASPTSRAPQELKDAAKAAIDADVNQYAITWGAQRFREAIAAKIERTYPGWTVDPERQICVTCGVDRGDDRRLPRPRSTPATRWSSSSRSTRTTGPTRSCPAPTPRYVTLHEPDWTFDEAELRAAFNERTRAIIVNTPHNPTGKVFTRAELELIAELCQRWDVARRSPTRSTSTSTYDGPEHVPLGHACPGMEDRTVTINALSKTYSVTGWRVGWTIAPPRAHRRHPQGPRLPDRRRGRTAAGGGDGGHGPAGGRTTRPSPPTTWSGATCSCELLETAGFRTSAPAGAYYVMTDIAGARPRRRRRVRAAADRRRSAWPRCPAPASTRGRSSGAPSSGSRSPSGWRRSARRASAWPGRPPAAPAPDSGRSHPCST